MVYPMQTIFFLLGLLSGFYWFPMLPTHILYPVKYFIAFLSILILVLAKRFDKIGVNELLVLLILSCFLMGVLYHFPSDDFQLSSAIDYSIVALLLYISIGNFRVYSALPSLLEGVYFFSLISSLYTIISWYTSTNLAPEAVIHSRVSLDYNTMGFSYSHTVAAPTYCIGIIFLWSQRANHSSLVFFPALLILLGGLYLTTGEASAISLLLSSFLLYLPGIGRVVLLSFLHFGYLTFIHYAPTLSLTRLGDFLPTIAERLASLYAGFSMLKGNFWFGSGPGNSGLHFNSLSESYGLSYLVTGETLQPHSPFILLISEFGFWGILAGLLLFFLLCKALLQRGNDPLFLLFQNIVGYFAIVSLFEPWPFVSNLFITIVALLSLALVFSIYGTRSEKRRGVS